MPIDSPSLSDAINEHQYPHFLCVWPLALRAYHALVHLTTLRSWYVRRAWRRIETPIPKGATLLDVGCGSGDHLFYALRRRPDLTGIGIDRSGEAVELCRSYAEAVGSAGATFRRQNVDADSSMPEHDLALCIGMLQYVVRDAQLLRAIRRSLSNSGRLLLYLPVRNERIWPIYDRLIEGSEHDYDAVQERRRVYQPDHVRRLLDTCGFRVVTEESTYGPFGKAAFELHALILHGLTRRNVVLKVAAFVVGVVSMPAMLLLMLADYMLPVSRGNGMVVVAAPRRDEEPGIFESRSRT
ncbi:MAG: methyltransferase domain-containing protein [Rhodothermales bacterium]